MNTSITTWVILGVGIVHFSLSSNAEVRPSAPAAHPEIRDVDQFYDTLAPHGEWVDQDDHGQVWRPRVAAGDPSWRPYCHGGHWVSTASGWHWQSDYSWGWGPFHYGRWYCCPRLGWVWVPGTVWAPAWVHWRSSSEHFGWAPLPPGAGYALGIGLHFDGRRIGWDFHFGLTDRHYTFIERSRFLSPCISTAVVTGPRFHTIYRGSHVVRQHYSGSGSRRVSCSSIPTHSVPGYSRRSSHVHSIVTRTTTHRPTVSTAHGSHGHSGTSRGHSIQRYPATPSTHRSHVSQPSSRSRSPHGHSSAGSTVRYSPSSRTLPSSSRGRGSSSVSRAPAVTPRPPSVTTRAPTVTPRTTTSSQAGRRTSRVRSIISRR